MRQTRSLQEAGPSVIPFAFKAPLFAGSIGRTDLPGGDYQTLLRSITEVLFALGDDAIVHSGHGPDTTIGKEKKTNPFVLEYLAARR